MIKLPAKIKQNIIHIWPQIRDHPYRILIIGECGSGKTNKSLNPIFHLHAKDPYKSKYQLLIKKPEDAGIKHNDPKAFMEYSSTIYHIYDNINDYNPNRSPEILTVLDDMIADMNTNKKFCLIIKELFI